MGAFQGKARMQVKVWILFSALGQHSGSSHPRGSYKIFLSLPTIVYLFE